MKFNELSELSPQFFQLRFIKSTGSPSLRVQPWFKLNTMVNNALKGEHFRQRLMDLICNSFNTLTSANENASPLHLHPLLQSILQHNVETLGV
jgi:hypothetical protein